MKPNKRNLHKWAKALESGEYQQTTSTLRDENGYCCLGVACEVALKNGVKMHVEMGEDSWRYDTEEASLPKAVQEWLGVDNSDPLLNFDGEEITAISANDLVDKNFTEIARAIRRTYDIKLK
jgi:hypothetical protein